MKERTWHFVDRTSGEEFFVVNVYSYGAKEEAKKYFEQPFCLGLVDDAVAEMMGLDTYR